MQAAELLLLLFSLATVVSLTPKQLNSLCVDHAVLKGNPQPNQT
jgi:hypothetical protein